MTVSVCVYNVFFIFLSAATSSFSPEAHKLGSYCPSRFCSLHLFFCANSDPVSIRHLGLSLGKSIVVFDLVTLGLGSL